MLNFICTLVFLALLGGLAHSLGKKDKVLASEGHVSDYGWMSRVMWVIFAVGCTLFVFGHTFSKLEKGSRDIRDDIPATSPAPPEPQPLQNLKTVPAQPNVDDVIEEHQKQLRKFEGQNSN